MVAFTLLSPGICHHAIHTAAGSKPCMAHQLLLLDRMVREGATHVQRQTLVSTTLQVLTCDFLHGSHVSSASGTAWKEGHMDFTGMANEHSLHRCVMHPPQLMQHKHGMTLPNLCCICMRSINVAGAQMVLTLKMISAAVCYHDGLMPAQVCSAFDSMPPHQDTL